MLQDANRLEASVLTADVCIVGGGVAGISIALSLSRQGLKVVMLEGGGEAFSHRSQSLYEGEVWDSRYSLTGTRTRMLGGSSNCWGGWCRPMTDNDYDERDWLGGLGWPIGEADMAPHYAEAARLLQVPMPETDAALIAALDPDLARTSAIGGDRFRTVFFGMSPPTAFGKAYGAELGAAPGVTVLLNATATRLETDATGDRVSAVRVRSDRGTFRVEATLVVLAAGGIENPRLMLASGGIGNGRDLVGRYFMDHPRMRLRYLTLEGESGLTKLYDARHYGGGSMVGKRGRTGAAFSPTLAEQREAGILQSYTGLVACYFGQSDATLEDARQVYKAVKGELHERIDARRIGRVVSGLPVTLAYVLGRKLDLRGKQMRFEVETVVEPMPDRDNRVQLIDRTDRHGVPMVHLTWRRHDIERRTHQHALGLVQSALEEGGFGRSGIDPAVWDPERWDSTVITTWHHMGTTRMGASPDRAVVDADCRVFGMSNLYVTGSSVFSTGGGVPPTFMVTALALRLADHVATRLARKAAA